MEEKHNQSPFPKLCACVQSVCSFFFSSSSELLLLFLPSKTISSIPSEPADAMQRLCRNATALSTQTLTDAKHMFYVTGTPGGHTLSLVFESFVDSVKV